MATLTIRNLEDEVRDKLRIRAAQFGRSMEDEVRFILRGAVNQGQPTQIWSRGRYLFSDQQGISLDLPARSDERPTPDFS